MADRAFTTCDSCGEMRCEIIDNVAPQLCDPCLRARAGLEGCDICDGYGWTAISYSDAPELEGWTPIQRCDHCSKYEGDIEAAMACVAFNGGGELRFGWDENNQLPSGENVLVSFRETP